MTDFLAAHGYDPGPTQSPGLAGAIAGALATVPATAALSVFGSLGVEAAILDLSVLQTLAAGVAAMALAGGAYGRLFRRAANDKAGGWLFGAAFGFVLWTGGAVMVLPVLGDGRIPAGRAAIGLYVALVLWGATAGALFPFVHRRLRRDPDLASRSAARAVGPSAAAVDGCRRRR